jgi:hypothetical protein
MFYYYVVVTNTNNYVNGNPTASVTSDVAIVTVNPAAPIDAQTPTITAQPIGRSYNPNDTAQALIVEASVSDGGSLSYQWYKNTENNTENATQIDGEIATTFTPPTNAIGTLYYYVTVTNTNNYVNGNPTASVTSDVAAITITNDSILDAATPAIITQPAYYTDVAIDDPLTLSVGAYSPDGGSLSYQWYSNTSHSNSGGTQIGGATSADYQLSTENAGTFYYYVVVTNTNNNVNGNPTASVPSDIVIVTANPVQTPNITAHPQSATYNVGDPVTPLSVTASVRDGGTLSYQWFSNTANSEIGAIEISGANEESYTPSTATDGTTYYFVRVINTNTNASGKRIAVRNSAIAKIKVNPPVIAGHYYVSFYNADLDFVETRSIEQGSINPSSLRGGQWYKANASSPTTSHSLNEDINFYAAPSVQEIRTETELNDVRNKLWGKYILLNDIELTSETLGEDDGEGWNPIGYYFSSTDYGYFTGVFNGNGYAIRNLWINRPSTNYIGLFGYIDNGAKIKNLGVAIDSSKGGVKGAGSVGGIAGYVIESFITNSYSTGNVKGGGIAGYVGNSSSITNSYSTGNVRNGGIAGFVYNSSITDSYSTGNVSGTNYVGGIAGYVESSSITNSYSTGNISGTSSGVGGIAGIVIIGSTITNSYSTGNISGYFRVGGIAGDVRNEPIYSSPPISITNSYSTGNISGYFRVGGIAGHVSSNSTSRSPISITDSYSTGDVRGANDVGGIAGFVSASSITDSYSTGNVSGGYCESGYVCGVGGIAGFVSTSSITNSYSTGDVSGKNCVGGIAGIVFNSSFSYPITITNSYSTGSVSGTSNVGGIAGYVYGSNFAIKNNAAINKEVNGSSDVNRIVGFIGGSDNTIENNFALNNMKTNYNGGVFSNAGDLVYHGTPKSIDDFKLQSTYSSGLGWRFGNDDENPWQIDPSGIINDGYPYLYWLE